MLSGSPARFFLQVTRRPETSGHIDSYKGPLAAGESLERPEDFLVSFASKVRPAR